MTRIAIVDDEVRLADILAILLKREGYQVDLFYDPSEFVKQLDDQVWDVVVTDLKMPNISGIEVLQLVVERLPHTTVVVMTAHGTIETAVEAMKLGAFDYVQKPFDNHALKATLRNAVNLSRLQRENAFLKSSVRSGGVEIVAESPLMKASVATAIKVAGSDATVLITGDSGTGKEVIARTVHLHSRRVDQPFIAVNCKSLSPSIIESELFGHVKGAFTGAQSDRAGWFERANGGTLFLDEIGELDLAAQGKLLRVLQEREIVRLGDTEPRKIDVRFVAATNRDLQAEVEAETFREDLFYRLAVIPIHLSPLKDRVEDIAPLVDFFISKRAASPTQPGITKEAIAYLISHSWPGNVRELENTIERALILCDSQKIELDDVRLMTKTTRTDRNFETLADRVDRETAAHIERALELSDGKKNDAADLLGVERTTLYRLMKRLGMSG